MITRPCTTMRDSENIHEQSSLQKYTTCLIFGQKIFFGKKKFFWSKKIFWSKFFFGRKNFFGQKHFLVKKNFGRRVQNIIFDVLGPLAFQKYSIIKVY